MSDWIFTSILTIGIGIWIVVIAFALYQSRRHAAWHKILNVILWPFKEAKKLIVEDFFGLFRPQLTVVCWVVKRHPSWLLWPFRYPLRISIKIGKGILWCWDKIWLVGYLKYIDQLSQLRNIETKKTAGAKKGVKPPQKKKGRSRTKRANPITWLWNRVVKYKQITVAVIVIATLAIIVFLLWSRLPTSLNLNKATLNRIMQSIMFKAAVWTIAGFAVLILSLTVIVVSSILWLRVLRGSGFTGSITERIGKFSQILFLGGSFTFWKWALGILGAYAVLYCISNPHKVPGVVQNNKLATLLVMVAVIVCFTAKEKVKSVAILFVLAFAVFFIRTFVYTGPIRWSSPANETQEISRGLTTEKEVIVLEPGEITKWFYRKDGYLLRAHFTCNGDGSIKAEPPSRLLDEKTNTLSSTDEKGKVGDGEWLRTTGNKQRWKNIGNSVVHLSVWQEKQ